MHARKPLEPDAGARTLAARIPGTAAMPADASNIGGTMRREFSAGGVVVRRFRGDWQFVAIRPLGKTDVWALPKGHLDGRESEAEAAIREVREETGVRVTLDEKLGDVTYWFRADGDRIYKQVAFFLLLWQSGSPMPQAAEVEQCDWFDLERANEILSYPGERDIALKASETLAGRMHHS
jgi:8-oxo-dGTP pyrophosphatase MutT (NUDIX family)